MDWTLNMTAGSELLAETLYDIREADCFELYEIMMAGNDNPVDQPVNDPPPNA